jgi:hypothetical protein
MRYLVLLICLLPLGLAAQSKPDSSARWSTPRLTFKTNASTLLNPFKQAVAFTTDVRLAPRITADVGAGAIISSVIFADNKGESYLGLRLRGGVKYYLFHTRRAYLYAGIEGKYQNVHHNSIQNVFRQGRQYIEIMDVERNVQTSGVALRAGWQIFFGPKRRVFIEPYAGIGAAFHHVTRNLPPDAELINMREFINFEYTPGSNWNTDILLGLHVGVALW